MKLKTLLELPTKIKIGFVQLDSKLSEILHHLMIDVEKLDDLKNMITETNNKLIKLNEKIEKLENFYKIEQTVSSLSDEQQWTKEQQEKEDHSRIDYLYAN